MSKSKTFLRLMRYMFRYKGLSVLALLFILLTSIVATAIPLLAQYYIDNFITKNIAKAGLYILIIYFGLFILRVVFTFLGEYYFAKVAHSIVRDLRNDSFTQFIAEEAYIVQKRMHDKKPRIINYLAWPLYNKNKSSEDKWYVKYPQILECKKVEPAEDVKDNIGKTKYIDKDTILNRYVRSRCFTKMREESINDSDVRIFAGGKLRGYSTKMPGILEEFCIAWNSGKPIYLVGGLGGMSQIISNLISDNDTDKKRKEISDNILSEEWQKENNIDTKYSIKYGDMQKYARYKNPKYAADYVEVKDMIRNIKIEDLSAPTGLEPGEYKQLITTPFVDEVVYLIIKGLTKNNETIEGENDNV